jgi:hypothetical protein
MGSGRSKTWSGRRRKDDRKQKTSALSGWANWLSHSASILFAILLSSFSCYFKGKAGNLVAIAAYSNLAVKLTYSVT